MGFTQQEYQTLCFKIWSEEKRAGQVCCVKSFLNSHKMAIDDPGAEGYSLIALAVRAGLINDIPCLLECGANINQRDTEGNTLLHHAIAGAFLDDIRDIFNGSIIQLLMDQGLSLNDVNNKGESPLFAAWWMFSRPNTPPLPAQLLRFTLRRLHDVLGYASGQDCDIFQKNALGQSFVDASPRHAFEHNGSALAFFDAIMLPYKDQQEALNIAQAVCGHGVDHRKSKI